MPVGLPARLCPRHSAAAVAVGAEAEVAAEAILHHLPLQNLALSSWCSPEPE